MGKRQDIILAVKEILNDTNLFKKIYTEPTDIENERSFPIAWISLGSENISEGSVSTTNYLRTITLNIDLGTRHHTTDFSMDELIDTIFDLIKDNYTLKGTIINLNPTNIMNSGGHFHPYSLATLVFTALTR